MSYGIILPILVTFITLVLSIVVLIKNTGDIRNQILFWIIFLSALWIASGFLADHSLRLAYASFWTRFAIVPPAFVLPLLLYFSIIFPNPKKLSLASMFLLFIPAIVYAILSSTSLNIIEITMKSWGVDYIPGILYHIFIPYFILYLLLALRNFTKSYRKGDKVVKSQITFILLGLFTAFAIGVVTNILFPLIHRGDVAVFGPSFAILALTGCMTYGLLKHHLFNIKIIASEVVTVVIATILLLQVLIADPGQSQFVHAILFVLFVFLGTILIRSVINEEQQRERLQALTEQLETSNEKLKEADRLKTEFLGLASHQLRSPLTIISGKASMLLDGSYGEIKSEEQRIEINHILQFTKNLISLIEDLLNVSKIEQGGMKYEIKEFDMKKLVLELVQELNPLATNKGLELTFTPDDFSYLINGDELKIRQVILNLIDNAIKYTEKGFVYVSLAKNKSELSIKIEDSGIGMSKETIKNLFQKFSRGENGIIKSDGSGLGLYLAKEIITAHSGQIKAESKGIGMGSIFTITISNCYNKTNME